MCLVAKLNLLMEVYRRFTCMNHALGFIFSTVAIPSVGKSAGRSGNSGNYKDIISN